MEIKEKGENTKNDCIFFQFCGFWNRYCYKSMLGFTGAQTSQSSPVLPGDGRAPGSQAVTSLQQNALANSNSPRLAQTMAQVDLCLFWGEATEMSHTGRQN